MSTASWILLAIAIYLAFGLVVASRYGRDGNNVGCKTFEAIIAGLLWPCALLVAWFE